MNRGEPGVSLHLTVSLFTCLSRHGTVLTVLFPAEQSEDRRSGKEPWNPLHRDASSFLIPFHLRPKGRYAGETGEDEERYERHSVTPGLSLSPPLTRFTRYPQGEDSTVQGETDPVG